MAQVKKWIQELRTLLDNSLNQKNFFTDQLNKIEQKTGVKKMNIALGLIVFLALYLMVGYGGDFLCNFIGFLYPAYASIKAVESAQKDDDTKWLTYWVVYSIFHLLEYFTDLLLFWVPFYWFLKCAFLVYCMVPTNFNGSIAIYHNLIKPYFLKYEKTVDSHIEKAKDFAKEMTKEGKAL